MMLTAILASGSGSRSVRAVLIFPEQLVQRIPET